MSKYHRFEVSKRAQEVFPTAFFERSLLVLLGKKPKQLPAGKGFGRLIYS